jgi:molecular chaperone DnaK
MYLGIDFGTTFSQISTMYLGQPLLLLNPGEYGIPSVFYFDKESGPLIGNDALNAGQGNAAVNLVREVKMSIKNGQTFTLDGQIFSSKEIVREIFKTLITNAIQVARTRSLNTKIEGIVICIPAKFGVQERHLIYEAAKECMGTKSNPIKAIIKEPVAAAISYYSTNIEDGKNILVYDLGGGTCDVALVRSDSKNRECYTVIDSDMERIGGRNWDEVLVKYITERIEKDSGIKIKGNIGYEEKIRRTAVTVKHDLSNHNKTKSTARVELNNRIYSTVVTRDTFDEITSHLLKETLDCLQDIYDEHIKSMKIDEIICVGGSSNMIQVEKGLLKRFPNCLIRIFEPEHAVVNGATIYANSKLGVLKDISSFSYGVKANDPVNKTELISNILIKGCILPTQNAREYNPVNDNQSGVNIGIFESENKSENYDFAELNKRYVGEMYLELPPNSKKSLVIKCLIKQNTDGLLEVEASEPSGKRISAQFKIEKL